jgi:hypothetical protein
VVGKTKKKHPCQGFSQSDLITVRKRLLHLKVRNDARKKSKTGVIGRVLPEAIGMYFAKKIASPKGSK